MCAHYHNLHFRFIKSFVFEELALNRVLNPFHSDKVVFLGISLFQSAQLGHTSQVTVCMLTVRGQKREEGYTVVNRYDNALL